MANMTFGPGRPVNAQYGAMKPMKPPPILGGRPSTDFGGMARAEGGNSGGGPGEGGMFGRSTAGIMPNVQTGGLAGGMPTQTGVAQAPPPTGGLTATVDPAARMRPSGMYRRRMIDPGFR